MSSRRRYPYAPYPLSPTPTHPTVSPRADDGFPAAWKPIRTEYDHQEPDRQHPLEWKPPPPDSPPQPWNPHYDPAQKPPPELELTVWEPAPDDQIALFDNVGPLQPAHGADSPSWNEYVSRGRRASRLVLNAVYGGGGDKDYRPWHDGYKVDREIPEMPFHSVSMFHSFHSMASLVGHSGCSLQYESYLFKVVVNSKDTQYPHQGLSSCYYAPDHRAIVVGDVHAGRDSNRGTDLYLPSSELMFQTWVRQVQKYAHLGVNVWDLKYVFLNMVVGKDGTAVVGAAFKRFAEHPQLGAEYRVYERGKGTMMEQETFDMICGADILRMVARMCEDHPVALGYKQIVKIILYSDLSPFYEHVAVILGIVE